MISRTQTTLLIACAISAAGANPEFLADLGVAGPISGIAVDASGATYLTGSVSGIVLPTTPGVLHETPEVSCIRIGQGPCGYGFVMKRHADGSLAWATYLGNFTLGVKLASDGSIWAVSEQQLPSQTVTVTRLDAQGRSALASFSMPAFASRGVALGPDGSLHLCGSFSASRTFPVTPGAFQTVPLGTQFRNLVVAKIRPDGSGLAFATYLGGIGDETCSDIAVGPDGSVFVTGTTASLDFPVTENAYQRVNFSEPIGNAPGLRGTAFVTRLTADGSALLYSTFLGGSHSETANAIEVDRFGNAVVLGGTTSSNFPFTAEGFQPTGPSLTPLPGTNVRGFTVKLNRDGSQLLFATSIGGYDLALNAVGSAIITGTTPAGFPATPGAFQSCYGGGEYDAFIARVDPQGNLAEATLAGGQGVEHIWTIAAGADNTFYLAGFTNSEALGGSSSRNTHFLARLRISGPRDATPSCAPPAVENAAGYATGAIAPGEVVTLLTPPVRIQQPVSATPDSNGMYPTSLAGVRVLVDGEPAPLLYVSSNQVNAVLPFELDRDIAHIDVERSGNIATSWALPVEPAAPGIFLLDYNALQGAILNEDGTVNSPANPARVGSAIAIYGSGGGVTLPPSATGAVTSGPLRHSRYPVRVWLGGQEVAILFSGAAPGLIAGVTQTNVRVPPACTGNAKCLLELSIDGRFFGLPITIAVQ